MTRLYTPYIFVFKPGLISVVRPDQARYLSLVLRLKPLDEILIFNGRDGEWRAKLTEMSKKAVHIEIMECVRPQTRSEYAPKLLMALIKRTPLETVIEKATELGVGDIQLMVTRRTNADHTKVSRLQRIAEEASEQTERLDVPEVKAPLKLEVYLKTMADGERLVYGDEESTHETTFTEPSVPSMLNLLRGLTTGPVSILIGPEGGFDNHERQMLKAHPRCYGVNLGPRILRADTAALSALTLYQAVSGDWK
jgi:16S rRNA (uracil1498-N3)-methyltransferase